MRISKEDERAYYILLGYLFGDPLCKVTLKLSDTKKGHPAYEVLEYVPESEANAFAQLWKTTDYKSAERKLTLNGIMGSYTIHYSGVFAIKVEHM